MSDPLQHFRAELARMEEDTKYTATTYFVAEGRYRAAHNIVGVLASLSAVAAAATILTPYEVATGVLALASGALSAYLTVRRLDQDAAQSLAAGRRLNALSTLCRQARTLRLAPGAAVGSEEALQIVADLTTEIGRASEFAPGTTSLHFWLARRRIKKGYFEHGVSEDEEAAPAAG